MEINNNAPAFSALTITSTILSWVTLFNAQYFLSFVLTIVGIVSGIFAIRYYYFAGELKKKQLKED
jgi:hypothetical protein